MTRVAWNAVDSGTFEDMVSVLVSILHPEAQRIDGSGGDGGREVQFAGSDGLEFFQMKSFTGRLDTRSGRRAQVVKSLDRAAKGNPAVWSLVVPIDPTPAEERWFAGLRGKYPFELKWLGKAWLDEQMARHPYLVRYFLEHGSDEAIRLLKQLKEETAALTGGVPEALERVRRLADLLNGLDPYYTFELTVAAENTAVAVRPRYAGAEQDRPITVSVSARFPDSPEGRQRAAEYHEAMGYGTGVTLSSDELRSFKVDAPAGMSAEFTSGTLVATPVQDASWQLPGRLLAVEPSGVIVGALPVTFKERTAGPLGYTITCWDRTGTLSIKQRIEMGSRAVEAALNFKVPEDAHPGLVLPILRFLHRLAPPNMLQLEVDGKNAAAAANVSFDPQVDDDYLDVIEALDRIQAGTATYFPIPDGFTRDDLEAIQNADCLLKGEAVRMTWEQFTFAVSRPEGLDAVIGPGHAPQAYHTVHPDYAANVAGNELHLGAFQIDLASAVVANLEELKRQSPLEPGGERIIRLTPGSSNEAELRLTGGAKAG